MENYDFCEELKKVYKNNLFDDDTIVYYLNGFIDCLGLQMKEGDIKQIGFSKIKDRDNNEYVSDSVIKQGDDYEIKFMKNNGKNDFLRIEGKYQDLKFEMDTYYCKRKLRDDRISNLPFRFSLLAPHCPISFLSISKK